MNHSALSAASAAVRKTWPEARPRLAIIMGSGWRDAAQGFPPHATMEYSAIPLLGMPGVEGHGGQIILAGYAGTEVLIFAGRRHWYEGAGLEAIAFPVHLARTLGAEGILLTNSAGGINPAFPPGSVMLLKDHINGMGVNPLAGPHDPFWGPRFPDMSEVYDAGYRTRLTQCAARTGLRLVQGTYMAVSGPSYETPAEIAAFRNMGADAVGMSTVPEAILAHAAGLRVAGLSCITNMAAGLSGALSHQDVLAQARAALPGLARLLQSFVQELSQSPNTG